MSATYLTNLKSFWLGPVQIPPLPAAFGMTDRVTGTVYYPTVSADGKTLAFTTVSPVGAAPVKVLGPNDGPFVGQYSVRLGVSNGHVVADGYSDMGAGPFVRCATATTVMAVFFMQALVNKGIYDHLAFQSDATTGGIFDPTP